MGVALGCRSAPAPASGSDVGAAESVVPYRERPHRRRRVHAATLGDAPVEDVVVGSLDGDDRRPDMLLLGEAPMIVRGHDSGRP